MNRWAPWLAGAVLVAGVASYAATRLTRGSSTPSAATVALAPQARAVAREFVATAVARKHLDRAWSLAAARLRHGTTHAEWMTGVIPVQPYPVAQARASYAVQSSRQAAAVLQITFTPRPTSSAEPGTFLISLVRVDGHWLVSSWTPRSLLGAHG